MGAAGRLPVVRVNEQIPRLTQMGSSGSTTLPRPSADPAPAAEAGSWRSNVDDDRDGDLTSIERRSPPSGTTPTRARSRFGQVHVRADRAQLLDHEPPAGRRLQRDLERVSAEPPQEPAETAALRGNKKRAKNDRADARHHRRRRLLQSPRSGSLARARSQAAEIAQKEQRARQRFLLSHCIIEVLAVFFACGRSRSIELCCSWRRGRVTRRSVGDGSCSSFGGYCRSRRWTRLLACDWREARLGPCEGDHRR